MGPAQERERPERSPEPLFTPSHSLSEHATKSQNILRLTKAAVSELSPSTQHPLVPIFPLTGDPLLSQVSRYRENIGLMAGVDERELLEPRPQSWLGEPPDCIGQAPAVRDISKPLEAV